ncbi:MAG: phosphatidylglycerophosphatase A [Candidatus Cloacimonadales bacterium]|jgi:phosphatidylglycerophosphatase A|nr:phosphatidylglycerophosphatase A [Candidatus Cloacimonadales bacterium]
MNSLKKLIEQTNIYFSTLFGIGYIPFMPGTFGTLAAAILWFLIPDYIFYNSTEKTIYIFEYAIMSGIVAILFFLGVYLTGQAEKQLGKDNGKIIFDELVGYLVAVLFLPKTLMICIYAFVLFRVFDIGKPYPISKSQNLKGGWGVMIDDAIAGLFANALMQILILIYPNFFK